MKCMQLSLKHACKETHQIIFALLLLFFDKNWLIIEFNLTYHSGASYRAEVLLTAVDNLIVAFCNSLANELVSLVSCLDFKLF